MGMAGASLADIPDSGESCVDRMAVGLSWLGNYDTYVYLICVVLIAGGSENATDLV